MLLLTFLLEPAAAWWSPVVYRSMEIPFHWGEMPSETVQNLLFVVGWWGYGSPPLSNGPFWSLSFECVYYALYGLWIYAPRTRWWAVPLLLLLTGPAIALLFPIWLLGVGLYDGYEWLHVRRNGLVSAFGAMLAYLAMIWAWRRPISRVLGATTVTARTAALTMFVGHFAIGRRLFQGQSLHWLDRLSLSYFLVGTGLAFVLLPVLLGLDRFAAPVPRGTAARVRLIADSTFPLYLLHWPYFLLVVCLHGGAIPDWRGGLLMLLGAVVISVGLAILFDRLKNAMRGSLRRYLAPRRPAPQR